MCLHVRSERMVATHDIVVVKWLRHVISKGKDLFFSPYYNHHYELKKKYTSLLSCQKSCGGDDYIVEMGLHSYLVNTKGYLDFFVTSVSNCEDDRPVFALGRIPKGSTYYVGEHGDIASDALILDKIFMVSVYDSDNPLFDDCLSLSVGTMVRTNLLSDSATYYTKKTSQQINLPFVHIPVSIPRISDKRKLTLI